MNTDSKIKTAVIYKLMSEGTKKCYIGSTTRKLVQRLTQHKCDYKRYCNGKNHYVTSFEIIETGNPYIVEIERVTGDKHAILARERHHIENTENTVNKCIAGRTMLEYKQDNKQKIQKYLREYYQDNKQKMQEQKQEYYQKNKETLNVPIICELCGGKYTTTHKARHQKSKMHLNKIQ